MLDPTVPGHLSARDPVLTERQRAVLGALVALHGASARPVGSDRIAREARMGLSGASIRAALAELEDLGLLERGHASAGRIPSARGWELYVRTIMAPAVLPPEMLAEVDRHLLESRRDVEHLLHEASRLLASLTRQLGLAVAATLEHEVLTGLDLQPLSDRRALLVLGLAGRAVRSLVLELDSPLSRRALAEVESVLRERLLGHALASVRRRLDEDPELVRHSAVRIVARTAAAAWMRPVAVPLLSAGAGHIARIPEFSDVRQLGDVLRVVEAGAPLDRLMVSGLEGQVGVRVGISGERVLASMSLVSYTLPGSLPGAVAVLGPLRMDYALTLAVVDAVGSRVTDLLSA
jgi:heat-inducible transcriptional repressor